MGDDDGCSTVDDDGWITNQPATNFTKLTGTMTLNTTLRGQQSVFHTEHIFIGDLHPSLGEQYGYHGVIPGQTKLICAYKCILPLCYMEIGNKGA